MDRPPGADPDPDEPETVAASSVRPPEVLADDHHLQDCERVLHEGVRCPTLGRIVLLERVGKGGMGVVYRGFHPRLQCEVAVKVLPRGLSNERADLVGRFLREARLAARVVSPHLVTVHDVDEDMTSGCRFLVMEFVRGVTAGAWARAHPGATPESDVLVIAAAATRGLATAHASGIVHRDVKPENVLVPFDGEGRADLARAKLADLGLARAQGRDASLDGSHGAMGTPGYMSPEQVDEARAAGPGADVFGMGATIYALLTGRAPFAGTSMSDALLRTATVQFTPLGEARPGVSRAMADLVHGCLRRDAQQRPPDGAALLARIEACQRALAAPESPAPRDGSRDGPPQDTADAEDAAARPAPPPPAPRISRRLVALLGLLAAVAVAGSAAALWTPGDAAPPRGTGGGNRSDDLPPLDPPVDLRVIGEDFTGYETLRTKALRDALAEMGVRLRYSIYRTHAEAARALDGGEADVMLAPVTALLRQPAAGRIVAVIDHTAGGDAIVVNTARNPELATVAGLRKAAAARPRDRRLAIAYKPDSCSEFLAMVLDSRVPDFRLSDFRVHPTETAEEAAALLDDPQSDVVAAVVWEPIVAHAVRKGHKVLLSSADVPEAILDAMFASEAALRDRPEAVRRLVLAYYARMETYALWPEEMGHQLFEGTDVTEEEQRAILGGLRFFGPLEAAEWFRSGKLMDGVRATAQILSMRGSLPRQPDAMEEWPDGRFAEEAAERCRARIGTFERSQPQLAERLRTARPGELPAR